jgi:hypothetical protein
MNCITIYFKDDKVCKIENAKTKFSKVTLEERESFLYIKRYRLDNNDTYVMLYMIPISEISLIDFNQLDVEFNNDRMEF